MNVRSSPIPNFRIRDGIPLAVSGTSRSVLTFVENQFRQFPAAIPTELSQVTAAWAASIGTSVTRSCINTGRPTGWFRL